MQQYLNLFVFVSQVCGWLLQYLHLFVRVSIPPLVYLNFLACGWVLQYLYVFAFMLRLLQAVRPLKAQPLNPSFACQISNRKVMQTIVKSQKSKLRTL